MGSFTVTHHLSDTERTEKTSIYAPGSSAVDPHLKLATLSWIYYNQMINGNSYQLFYRKPKGLTLY